MDSYSDDPTGHQVLAGVRAHFQTQAVADKVTALLQAAFSEALRQEGIVLSRSEQGRLRRAALTELLAAVREKL